MTSRRSALSSSVARRGRSAVREGLPHTTLVFNAVFLLLAVGSGASSPPVLEARAAARVGVLVAAFMAAALVTPRLLAWLRRRPAWQVWKARLSGAACGCAVVVLSSIVDVEAADWVPTGGRRGRRRSWRRCERASWTPTGCAWRRER